MRACGEGTVAAVAAVRSKLYKLYREAWMDHETKHKDIEARPLEMQNNYKLIIRR